MTRKVKSIKCPACGSRLIDASEEAAVLTVAVVAEDVVTYGSPQSDYYQKCHKCGKIIGLRRGPAIKAK